MGKAAITLWNTAMLKFFHPNTLDQMGKLLFHYENDLQGKVNIDKSTI